MAPLTYDNFIGGNVLGGKSPFDIFAYAFSESAAAALGIYFVPADQVVQYSSVFSIVDAG